MSNQFYNFAFVPPLSEEEKKNAYAELYDLPMPSPSEELVHAFTSGNEMSPEDALPITQIEKLFTPGSLKVKNGFCMLPDGTAYCCVYIPLPDITEEMDVLWTKERFIGQDDVHYKIWFPGMHTSHKMPPIENLGWGTGTVCFERPLIPMEILNCPPEILDPGFQGSRGCSGYFTLLDNPQDIWYNTTLNITRKLPDGGMEIQIVNWAGVHLIDGKPVRKIPENACSDLERCRLYAVHGVYENLRKNQILPLIWKIRQTI